LSSNLYDESVQLGNGRLDMVSVIEAIEARTEAIKLASTSCISGSKRVSSGQ